MALAFNMLRANDLIWSFVVSNYLLGKEPIPFDLLYWNADSTRMPAAMHSFYLRNMYHENRLAVPGGSILPGLRSTSRESRRPTSYWRRGKIISHRGSRPMPRPSYTRGQLSSCSPIPATSLGSLAHLAVGTATGKTQTSLRVRLNGSKPRTWFTPLGGRPGRNGYHPMPAVRSKHASPVDHCSRSRTHQAPMFVPVRSIENPCSSQRMTLSDSRQSRRPDRGF